MLINKYTYRLFANTAQVMHMLGRASQTLLEGKKKHIIQRAHKRKVEALVTRVEKHTIDHK